MKTLLLVISFLLFAVNINAQTMFFSVKIDSVNFVKPGTQEPILDTSIIRKLDTFVNKDDAIIYMYRMSSLVGCALKFPVNVENKNAKLGQKQYIVLHINTTKKNHWIKQKSWNINYLNFKPNKYYFYRLAGSVYKTGYLDDMTYNEFKTFKKLKF